MQKGTPTSDRIGAYRVLQELSVTGPVQVHLACEESTDGPSQKVVLKVVPEAPGRDAKDAQALIREGTACSRMTHPGIVRTSKVFRHQNAVVLVVEHLEGVFLAELLASGTAEAQRPLSDDAALLIGLAVCDALAHAHATIDDVDTPSPIVHRTVSPSNILIGPDGSVKLDGFGFAKVFGGVAAGETDETMWTPAYLAPEQVKDQPATPKVDVYAAALILWELLTGRKSIILPHDPLAIPETLKAVAERKIEPLAKLRPDLAEPLTSALDLALAPDPSDRNIGCAEMGRHIRKTFHFGRGKRELRDRVSAALARAAANDRGLTPRATASEPTAPASVPRPPASAPRVAASVPRATASAPRIPASAPRPLASEPQPPASAPRAPLSAPRSPASAPRLDAVAPRPLHQTLVGIAPLRLEEAAVAPPAARSVVSDAVAPTVNPFASTMMAANPIVSDVLATRDPANRVAIPPELAATLPLSFDASALRSESLSGLARGSGPHSSHLDVASDTLALPSESEGSEATKGRIDAVVPQRLKLGERLEAPTRWRRSSWVAAWIALTLGLGGVVAKISSRAPATSGAHPRTLAAVGSSATSAMPLPVVPSSAAAAPTHFAAPSPLAASSSAVDSLPVATVAPPSAAAPPSPLATPKPAEPMAAAPAVAAASPPGVMDEALKNSLLKRGLGLLTVHSTASHASVYVNLRLYGGPGEGLTIPCGKQFISIGVPVRRATQPVWLAPGRSMVIPCGGALVTTMNPRPLR